MSKSAKYCVAALMVLVLSATILFVMISFDEREHVFHGSCGVVGFTQYFLFTSAMLAFAFSALGMWHGWQTQGMGKTGLLTTVFCYFPLIFLSTIMVFASLLFFCVI